MVMTPDWESVGCEFKHSTGIFSFLKEKPSLISLILNTKLEKHDWNVLRPPSCVVNLPSDTPSYHTRNCPNNNNTKISSIAPIYVNGCRLVVKRIWFKNVFNLEVIKLDV